MLQHLFAHFFLLGDLAVFSYLNFDLKNISEPVGKLHPWETVDNTYLTTRLSHIK